MQSQGWRWGQKSRLISISSQNSTPFSTHPHGSPSPSLRSRWWDSRQTLSTNPPHCRATWRPPRTTTQSKNSWLLHTLWSGAGSRASLCLAWRPSSTMPISHPRSSSAGCPSTRTSLPPNPTGLCARRGNLWARRGWLGFVGSSGSLSRSITSDVTGRGWGFSLGRSSVRRTKSTWYVVIPHHQFAWSGSCNYKNIETSDWNRNSSV